MAPSNDSQAYLLDTSAILVLIEDEDGSERVDSLLRTESVLIPWVALLEIHYVTAKRQDQAEADRRYGLVSQLPVKVLWDNDERLLLTASRLKASCHLSVADSLIAAYALLSSAVLVHRDPEYRELQVELQLEELPIEA